MEEINLNADDSSNVEGTSEKVTSIGNITTVEVDVEKMLSEEQEDNLAAQGNLEWFYSKKTPDI